MQLDHASDAIYTLLCVAWRSHVLGRPCIKLIESNIGTGSSEQMEQGVWVSSIWVLATHEIAQSWQGERVITEQRLNRDPMRSHNQNHPCTNNIKTHHGRSNDEDDASHGGRRENY